MQRYGDSFAADESGCYPFSMHRHFGMGWRAFADATGLQRRHDARGAWVWARKPEAAQQFTEDAHGNEHGTDGKFAKKGGGGSGGPKPSRAERRRAKKQRRETKRAARQKRRADTRARRADEARAGMTAAAEAAPHPALRAALAAAADGVAKAAGSSTRAEFVRHAAGAARAARDQMRGAAKSMARDVADRFVSRFAAELEPVGLTRADLERVAEILTPETATQIAAAADRRDEVQDAFDPDDLEPTGRAEWTAQLKTMLTDGITAGPAEPGDWETGVRALADEMGAAGVVADPKDPGADASDEEWAAYEREQEAAGERREQLAFSLLARWAVAAGWAKDTDAGADWASQRQFSDGVGSTGARSLPLDSLRADPERFQFRRGAGADGTVRELPAEPFDPAKCEPLAVWPDPADGSVNVIDGHHRFAWAKRDGATEVPVRFLEAPDAESAKRLGEELNRAREAA